MRTKLIGILLALVLTLVPLSGVGATVAEEDADVVVTAVPAWVSISVDETTWGPIIYGDGQWTITGDTGHFSITNDSSVATHNFIAVTSSNWTSTGDDWIHSDTATSDALTVGVRALLTDGELDWYTEGSDPVVTIPGEEGCDSVVVKFVDPVKIVEDVAVEEDWKFDLAMVGPTTITDKLSKENTVRVTAVSTNPGTYTPPSESSTTSSVSIEGSGFVLP